MIWMKNSSSAIMVARALIDDDISAVTGRAEK